MDTLLTAADAARILAVTPATVRLMATRGDLPVAVTTPRGIRLFREEAVAALAARRADRNLTTPTA